MSGPNLILLFDKVEGLEIKENDVVLYYNPEFAIEFENGIQVTAEHSDLNYYRNCIESAIDDVLQNNNLLSGLHEVISSSKNSFYNHIYCSVAAWIDSIEVLISKYNIEMITFSKILIQDTYLPFYEAEGEINKKFLYQESDFIPNIIKNILEKRYEKIKITTFRKANLPYLYMRIFFRRYVLLLVKIVFALTKKFQSHKKTKHDDLSKLEKCKYIVCPRGMAHTQKVEGFFKDEIFYPFVADSIGSKSKHYAYYEGKGSFSYDQHYLRYRDIMANFLLTIKLLSSIPDLRIELHNEKLNLKSSIREMIISCYEVLNYRSALDNFIDQNNINKDAILLNCELFTGYPYYFNNIAKKFSLRNIQIQTVALKDSPQTKFVYSDLFVFDNIKDYEDYKVKSIHSDISKFDYWGEWKKFEADKNKIVLNNIVFFTQPIEDYLEIQILRRLLDLSIKLDFELKIKLHPRDSLKKYSSLDLDSDIFIDSSIPYEVYLQGCDLCIIRTSSIAVDIIKSSIPIIYVLNSEHSQNLDLYFLKEEYYGIVNDLNELEVRLKNLEELLVSFNSYRNRVIHTPKEGSFIENINAYYNE